MINLETLKIACCLLSDPYAVQHLISMKGGNLSPEGWSFILGEIAADRIRAVSEKRKNKLLEEIDKAVDEANRTGTSFVFVVEKE